MLLALHVLRLHILHYVFAILRLISTEHNNNYVHDIIIAINNSYRPVNVLYAFTAI